MLKPGSDKRIPSAVASKKVHLANTATASLLDSSVSSCTGGSLEVVSLERFQQELEAMSSQSSSKDFTQTDRHTVRGDGCSWQHSSQRMVRKSRGKRNAPIVVCLRESIRAFGRGSKSQRPVSATTRRTLSESNASDVVVKLAPFGTTHGKKATKNFNAFLSAVEKAHTKEGRYALCSPQNINQSASQSDREQLNNSVDHQPTTDTQFDLSRLLNFCDNVEVIHNDLRSVVQDVSTASDDQSDKSEDSCSSRLSTTESDTEPADESSTNRKNNECCEVSPQHCPQCLAAYYACTHYYALGSKYFKIEVIEDDDANNAGSSYSQRVQTEPNSPSWMNSTSPSETLLEHRHIDVVSLDLTGSDVTFTVEQHATDTSSPQAGAALSSSPEFIHNFYCTMFGFVPCLPGYCFVPAFYFTFPMWSVPKPLSSMSKTPSQQRRHSSSQHGERLCTCLYDLSDIFVVCMLSFSFSVSTLLLENL